MRISTNHHIAYTTSYATVICAPSSEPKPIKTALQSICIWLIISTFILCVYLHISYSVLHCLICVYRPFCHFYAFAKTLGGGGIMFSGLSVREWVCASRKPCEHHISKNNNQGFHPILVADVFGFVDLLIRFWDQKVKRQGHSRRNHNRRRHPLEFHQLSLCFTLYSPELQELQETVKQSICSGKNDDILAILILLKRVGTAISVRLNCLNILFFAKHFARFFFQISETW